MMLCRRSAWPAPDRDLDPAPLPFQHEVGRAPLAGLGRDREGLHGRCGCTGRDLGASDVLRLYRFGIAALLTPLRDRAVHDHRPLGTVGNRVEGVAPRL